MRDTKLIGFDLDNTLYSLGEEEHQLMHQLIRNYICERVGEILGKDVEEVREQFEHHYSRLHSASHTLVKLGIESRDFAGSIVQEALENADIESVLQRDDRLVSMLDRLVHNYTLFLATGSSERIALGKLNALGVDGGVFRYVFYSGSEYLRHDGSLFEHLSKITGISFNEMFFVGDREKVDIVPASKLGIPTAIVNSESEIATYHLDTIYDLESILL